MIAAVLHKSLPHMDCIAPASLYMSLGPKVADENQQSQRARLLRDPICRCQHILILTLF